MPRQSCEYRELILRVTIVIVVEREKGRVRESKREGGREGGRERGRERERESKRDKGEKSEMETERQSAFETLPCVCSKRSRVCRQNDRVSLDTGVLTAHTGAF